jgi:3-deoxy-manno-octulosonate cytidylyltransferase (CMP-KDO synthetase)
MLIVIPARYDSTRFPGKPLAPLLGKPLIQWTWEAASRVPGCEVVVATDDARIQDACKAFGANVIRTSKGCRNGTERVAEAVAAMPWHANTEVVVNWQGDAPLVEADMLLEVAGALDAGVDVATPVMNVMDWPEDTPPPAGHVDVWLDGTLCALGFARGLVAGGPMWAHVGLYACRRAALMRYARWPEGAAEARVGLEQLRWLEHGAAIRCVPFEGPVPREVNYTSDVAAMEVILRARGV